MVSSSGMTLTDYVLYTIWCLFPLFFIGLIIWAKLEKLSNQHNRDDIGDYFRQAWFLIVCVALSIIIDRKFLADLVKYFPVDIPLLYYRLILFPLVMFIMGKIFGGSKKIEVEKNPLLRYHRPKDKK